MENEVCLLGHEASRSFHFVPSQWVRGWRHRRRFFQKAFLAKRTSNVATLTNDLCNLKPISASKKPNPLPERQQEGNRAA